MAREDWTDTAPHPWRRYAARIFDTVLLGGTTAFVISFIYTVVSAFAAGVTGVEPGPAPWEAMFTPYNRIIDGMLTLVLAVPGIAFLIGKTGSSPGKWIFGVRVLKDGAPIGFKAALRREMAIYVRGWALGVPLASLVTLILSYRKLTKDQITPWDLRAANEVSHRPTSIAAVVAMWSAVVAVVVAQVFLTAVGA